MKKLLMLYFFIQALLTSNVFAQDTVTLTMQQVFLAIDKRYPLLQLYELKVRAVRSLAAGANAWMPPTIALALDRFPYRLSLAKEMTPDNQAGIMFSVQQMIPNPSKLTAKRDYIASLENVQHNDLEWQKNILHFSARLYYYRRYSAEQKLRIIKQSRELLQMLIKSARDKYPFNQADLPAIFKAEASLSELNNMETMELSQIAESNIGLNTLMNREVNTHFLIDTLINPADYSNEHLVAPDSTQLLRNDILAVESRIRSMKFNQRLAATGAKPDFGIQFSHGQMFGMPNQFSIMGMITIPIVPWSSAMYTSEVKSMTFEIEAMQKEAATMRLMAVQMIREKITMIVYESQQLKNYDQDVLPSYQKNLEINMLAYRQNTGSFFVLLDAWNMLLMKQMERIVKLGQLLTLQSEYEYQREIK